MIFNPGVSGGGGLRLIASGENDNTTVQLPSPATYVIGQVQRQTVFVPPVNIQVGQQQTGGAVIYTLSADGMTLTMESATPVGNWYAYGF